MGHTGDNYDPAWLAGYATALANLNRLHDRPTMVRDVMDGDGIEIKHLKAAGVCSYDLRELKKALRPIYARKRKKATP